MSIARRRRLSAQEIRQHILKHLETGKVLAVETVWERAEMENEVFGRWYFLKTENEENEFINLNRGGFDRVTPPLDSSGYADWDFIVGWVQDGTPQLMSLYQQGLLYAESPMWMFVMHFETSRIRTIYHKHGYKKTDGV
jgi:hypothetical protein